MTDYRFFLIGHDGHIKSRIDHDCDDDLAALEHAKTLAASLAVEVWEAARFVARVKPGDKPLDTSDHAPL